MSRSLTRLDDQLVSSTTTSQHEDEGVDSVCTDDDNDDDDEDEDEHRDRRRGDVAQSTTKNGNDRGDESTSPRTRQRRYISRRLSNLQEMNAAVYSEIMIEPVLQASFLLLLSANWQR